MVRMDEDFRPLTERERSVLEQLLADDFPGVEGLRKQLASPLVRTIDEFGSLTVKPSSGEKAEVTKTVPVEAEFEDVDGVTISILLFVHAGLVYELQLFKGDDSAIIRWPVAEEMKEATSEPIISEDTPRR